MIANKEIFNFNFRQNWVDSIRGFAVVLIILGHWTTGFSSMANNDLSFIFSYIQKILSPFRLEILFFLSGLVVVKSLKKGKLNYYKGKLKNILWPYLIWSIIILFMFFLSGLLKNSNDDIFNIKLNDFFYGFLDLTWFLFFIFIFYCIIPFISKVNGYLVLLISFFISLYFYIYPLSIDKGSINFYDYFYYFMYFYLGYFAQVKTSNFTLSKLKVFFGFLCFLILIIIFTFFEVSKTFPFLFFLVFPSLFFLIYLSILCGEEGFINYIGKNSLVFYLCHYPIVLIGCAVLKKYNIEDFFIWFSFLFLIYFLCFFISMNKRFFSILFSFK